MLHHRPTFTVRLLASATSTLLAIGSLASTAAAANQSQAAEQLGSHTHQLRGIVKTTPASGAATFTVTSQRFGDVSVSYTGVTQRGKGAREGARSHEPAAASDLNAGERVIVLGKTSEDGKQFLARRVRVLPAQWDQEDAKHASGTITKVSAAGAVTTLTLLARDGSTESVSLSPDAKIRPKSDALADLTAGARVRVRIKHGLAVHVVILPDEARQD